MTISILDRMKQNARLIVPVLVSFVAAAAAQADDWPQWLGPKRDGVWRETGILERFPPEGPKVRWRVPVGGGYAGPAVTGGRVYVTDWVVADPSKVPSDPFKRGRIPGTERVRCLNEADGKLLWEHPYECTYTISYPAGPRTTPLVHGGKVYTLGAMGHLFCLDADKGQVLWSHDLPGEYHTRPPVWGYSSHLLLDGPRLFSMVGGTGSAVAAFDKDTGKELWRALTTRDIAYCPPTLIEAGGRRQLIIWHSESVNALDPETGRVYWSQPIKAQFGMAIATPRQEGDLLYLTSFDSNPRGGDGQTMMLRLQRDRPAADVAWRGQKNTGLYCTFATPLLEAGYVYGPCSYGQFRCVRADTGERLWETLEPTGGKKGRWANAFVIKNGDRFFLPNEKGDLIIARLSPKGYEEISRAHLLEPTSTAGGRPVLWSHPAFADRCLFERNDKELICVSLAAP